MKNKEEYKSDYEMLQEMRSNLKEIKQKLRDVLSPTSETFGYIDNYEAMKMLHVDKRTLSNWAKQGLLKKIKIRNKVYYKLSDIERMMEEQLKRA